MRSAIREGYYYSDAVGGDRIVTAGEFLSAMQGADTLSLTVITDSEGRSMWASNREKRDRSNAYLSFRMDAFFTDMRSVS